MVMGIGTDIIEIERIKKAVNRYGLRFLKRVYTVAEAELCSSRKDPYPCYAARFAAKEAVLKALGTGLAGCRWTDVEVCSTISGAPEVKLTGRASELARASGVIAVLLSLSHDRGRAVAFAVALKGGVEFAYCNSTGNERD